MPMNKNLKIYNNKHRHKFGDIKLQKSYFKDELTDKILYNKKIVKTKNAHNIAEGIIAREKSAINTKGDIMKKTNDLLNNGTNIYKFNMNAKNKLSKLFMWVMLFAFLLVLTFQPSMIAKNNFTQAGGPLLDGSLGQTYFNKAPMVVIGGSTDSTTNTINSGTKPLFTNSQYADNPNSVNVDVLYELLKIINDENVWGNKTISTDNSVTYLTARDFGKYGDQTSWSQTAKGNAQIVLKLLSDTTNTNSDLNSAAEQYWQVVYRSVSKDRDVLTLYMVDEYTDSQFNPNETTIDENNGKTYRYEANYSQSYLRDKVVIPIYNEMQNEYTKLNQYVVTPSNLPGYWQSSYYQTSCNGDLNIYKDSGIGASGHCYEDFSFFSICNGMDGYSTKNPIWQGEVENIYEDKLWVPSAFETLHTGFGSNENALLKDTGRLYDNDKMIYYIYDNDINSADANLYHWMTQEGPSSNTDVRTGLWELNSFDRATGQICWLRSALGDYNDSFPAHARSIHRTGYRENTPVTNIAAHGVRVALHLDLNALAQDYQLAQFSISEQGDAIMDSYLSVDGAKVLKAYVPTTSGSIILNSTFQSNSIGGLKSITNLNTNEEIFLSFNNKLSSKSENGIADITITNESEGTITYSISNVSEGRYQFNLDFHIPKFSLQTNFNIVSAKDMLLVISGESQVFVYKLTAGTTNVNITMPKLIVGRLYTITVVNGEISGQLVQTGDVTVNTNPYTFICNSEDATVTLSGITINSK